MHHIYDSDEEWDEGLYRREMVRGSRVFTIVLGIVYVIMVAFIAIFIWLGTMDLKHKSTETPPRFLVR